jgi:hypothetical protein
MMAQSNGAILPRNGKSQCNGSECYIITVIMLKETVVVLQSNVLVACPRVTVVM